MFLSLFPLVFHRPISPEARSIYSDALSFKSCTFDLNMEEDQLQNDINICDSNAAGGDSNVIVGDSNVGVGDTNVSDGDSNSQQTVNKTDTATSSHELPNQSKPNNDGGDRGTMAIVENSVNWQVQLNGRYH